MVVSLFCLFSYLLFKVYLYTYILCIFPLVRGIFGHLSVTCRKNADPPTTCFLKNNRSSLEHPHFVQQAITKLLKDGCIEECSSPPFCVNPLTVVDGKKLRLVIDLRHVNQCLIVPKFKYEDLRSLAQVVDQGHCFFTWDLKSGYHHVSIYQNHQQYLGFAWRFGHITRYFTFRVLPFGLSSACFCFTKILRPLVKR